MVEQSEPLKISVVIPVLNGSESLPELVRRLGNALERICGEHELILVNDGSKDSSWETISDLTTRYPKIRGINLMRNYGQHNAVLCGIRLARHPITVTMDDDLQHPPEEIGKLLARLNEGCDVVYGTPQQERHGILRDIASLVTKSVLQSIMGAKTARSVSAFRIFRTELRAAFANYRSPLVSIDVLLTWGTTSFSSISLLHEERQSGKSHYTFRKLVRHALNMMTGFSVLPLQLASIVGFGFTLFGIVVLVYVLGRYFWEGSSVAGFPFLASVIAIFSGAQLFALGIMGEYLARMHSRIIEKPAYAVKQITGS